MRSRVFVAYDHRPVTIKDVIKLVCRVLVGVDFSTAGDLELVHQLERAALRRSRMVPGAIMYQTGVVPLCSTMGSTGWRCCGRPFSLLSKGSLSLSSGTGDRLPFRPRQLSQLALRAVQRSRTSGLRTGKPLQSPGFS